MKPGNLIVYPSGYNEKGANSCRDEDFFHHIEKIRIEMIRRL